MRRRSRSSRCRWKSSSATSPRALKSTSVFPTSDYRAIADADGNAVFDEWSTDAGGKVEVSASAGGQAASVELRVLPGWISLLPAFLAIAVALLLRNVVPALLLGLWFGSMALQSFSPLGALKGLMDVLTVSTS